MTRPTIICHMITSIDGRLLADRWPCEEALLLDLYDAAADRLRADGWIVGRTTMAAHYLASGEAAPTVVAGPRADHVAPGHNGQDGIGICFDRTGRLRPDTGTVEGAHLVMVLGQQVAPSHVRYLAERGVSVFFVGTGDSALADVLARIGAAFGTRRLLLEGGGEINGAFLKAGLIDETSTLVFPVVDGQAGVPAIYDHGGATEAQALELIDAETVQNGCIWMRHRVTRDTATPQGAPR